MSCISLRPYQQAATRAIRQELTGKRSTLLVLPTGCGKTIVFCEVIKRVVASGGRALVLAHRVELIS